MEKSTERKIQYILKNFDFKKVHKIMCSLHWGWGTTTGDMKIPSATVIKLTAKRLLFDIVHSDWDVTSVGTGGLVARKYRDELKELHLELAFEVVSCDSD